MATLLNLVYLPCVEGPAATARNVPNAGSVYRLNQPPQPFNVTTEGSGGSSGPSLPTGPQWWPLTG